MLVANRIKVTIRDVDKGYKRVRRLFENYARRASFVKIGLLGTDADEERGDDGLTQAEIGAIHEYGSADGKIPQRSWIGSTFDEQREKLVTMAQELIGYVVDGKMPIEKALGILGLKLATEIKKKVTTGAPIPPPNAPAYAKQKEEKTRKGATHGVRTLIDTGRMIASVTWAIVVQGN